jgi:phenylacetate-coenzyme A ligase PaaK-like adenylate-forming protein
MDFRNDIFRITDEACFNEVAIEVFQLQYQNNIVYRDFVDALSIDPSAIGNFREIPFLPIAFFKSHDVICGEQEAEIAFLSSGTTGTIRSCHLVPDLSVYRKSILEGFTHVYGALRDCEILALVPSREENPHSSLGFMVELLMSKAHPDEQNYFLHDFSLLSEKIARMKNKQKRTILIGLTSSLLDFSEQFPGNSPDLIIIETGGMKGKRREMVREELHRELCEKFGVVKIHSEYGMTELLSQSYSTGDGIYSAPRWMKILIRDVNDPLSLLTSGQTGGINVMDLANFNSCSFIATEDLGKIHENNQFEISGRYDKSDIRGCNLMMG